MKSCLEKHRINGNCLIFRKRYATPFILWANYDIGSADEVVLGNNNLENLLLKSAGIELPVYNKFIEKVSEIIPVMNVNGYMDKSRTE